MTISKGKTVAITYTLTLDNGETIDSNVDAEPLTFTLGANEIIPGLENAVEGKKIGDTFKVSVQPEDGYGVLSEEAFIEVPKEHLPPEAWTIGAQLTAVDGLPFSLTHRFQRGVTQPTPRCFSGFSRQS